MEKQKTTENILIIDDKKELREDLVETMTMTPYNVFEAANGQEALEKLQSTDCDLIITDLRMPIMDGQTLIEKCFSLYPTLSVIVLTGHGEFEEAYYLLKKFNIADFLTKPLESPEKFLFTIENVLERQRISLKYNQLLEEHHQVTIQKKMVEFRNLLFGIFSHRINTPLTYISGSIELLKMAINADTLNDSITKYLNFIIKGNNILTSLLEKIRFYLKLSETSSLKLQLHSIVNLLENVINSLDKAIKEKHITCIVDNGQQDIKISCDAKLTEFAIKAIIENAIKYSPPNSNIRIMLQKHQQQLIISIADQGCGIPDHDHDKIFQEFALEKTQKNLEETLPLSLCIVRKIMQLHEGKVTVESKSGEGSVFKLFFKLGIT